MRVAAFLVVVATPAQADPVGDMAGFDDCIGQIIAQMPEHQHIDRFAPLACGRTFFDRRQSCNLPDNLLFEVGDTCRADDLIFWRSQVDWHETSQDTARSERLTEAIEFCANYYENLPQQVENCTTQAFYVDALTYMAGPALADWEANR